MPVSNKDCQWVVLDLETTGLDPRRDITLEVAAILVDRDLQALHTFHSVTTISRPVLDKYLGEYTTKMHTDNGLLGEIAARVEDLDYVDMDCELARWLKNACRATVGSVQLIGNSIHFDRSFLAVEFPRSFPLLHHRMIDVSTINVLQDAWDPWLGKRSHGPVAHRALADCQMSLTSLRGYRDGLLSKTATTP